MQVLYSRCCGLDVHQKTVVACVMITQANGKVDKSIRKVWSISTRSKSIGYDIRLGDSHYQTDERGSGCVG